MDERMNTCITSILHLDSSFYTFCVSNEFVCSLGTRDVGAVCPSVTLFHVRTLLGPIHAWDELEQHTQQRQGSSD